MASLSLPPLVCYSTSPGVSEFVKAVKSRLGMLVYDMAGQLMTTVKTVVPANGFLLSD